MPFDAGWFKELRGLSEAVLAATPHEGRFRPRVGDLCHAGHVSDRFLEETQAFVRTMAGTPYGLDDFFRAYPRHVVNFPAGSAFRMQWNIALTAGEPDGDDHVRIGLGFRLSPE